MIKMIPLSCSSYAVPLRSRSPCTTPLPRFPYATGHPRDRRMWPLQTRSAVENICRLPNLPRCYFYHFGPKGLNLLFNFKKRLNEPKLVGSTKCMLGKHSPRFKIVFEIYRLKIVVNCLIREHREGEKNLSNL